MEELRKQEVEEKLARYDELERKYASQKNSNAVAHNAMHGLQSLIQQGFIKVGRDGTVEPILDESERNQLAMNYANTHQAKEAIDNVIGGVNTKYDGLHFPAPM